VTVRGPACVVLVSALSADRNKRPRLEDQQHMPRGEEAALNAGDTRLVVYGMVGGHFAAEVVAFLGGDGGGENDEGDAGAGTGTGTGVVVAAVDAGMLHVVVVAVVVHAFVAGIRR